jgi:Dihydrodipicolinate reductase, N-terminus.
MKKFRVVQWGLGAMGSGMARLMLEKDGLELVGGIDMRPDFVGKDLGDVLGAGRKLGFAVTTTRRASSTGRRSTSSSSRRPPGRRSRCPT